MVLKDIGYFIIHDYSTRRQLLWVQCIHDPKNLGDKHPIRSLRLQNKYDPQERFDLKKSKNLALSSHPKPTCFIRPISPISVAQTGDKVSVPPPIVETNSLSWKLGELGESEGDKSLMDSVRGISDVEIENTCESGLRKPEGMECDKVGESEVGGSILAHMMKTLYFDGGTEIPLNTFPNRKSPRPLLVVHSGKTTIGRPAFRAFTRTSSNDFAESELLSFPKGGALPVNEIISRREDSMKPLICARSVGARAAGVEIAAEPVPVLRPGVVRGDAGGGF